VADGSLAPEVMHALIPALEAARKSVETEVIEQRLAKLEEQAERKGRR
jgi:hypothetical protein